MDRTQLSQLVVFVAVAKTGSFRAAADQLGIAPSAVSHAVSTLEGALGLRLLARTTRSTRPTEEGERLLARVAGPLAEIETGFAEVTEDAVAPSGPLRITMPLLAVQEVIMRRLPAFVALYPTIELDIRVSDTFENIVEEGCDAGIRLGESLEIDMIAVRAGGARRGMIVGAPAYFAGHPKPLHPRDLAAHNCIRRRFQSGRIYRWELERDGHAVSVGVNGNLILPQQELMRQAALDGIGLAFLFEESVLADVRAGRLISVMEEWCPPFDGFYIYYPSRRLMRPALRAFIEFFRYGESA
ncbi:MULTISPECIES: LysR family transcriptional regulator [unclassified Pseudomonas]|jgi:DNA-binding transcriptional LysR family regulator|uniref:LysR family transcriptional regulator n=1 Tax=unclassified Pseudomonas TaxID=196821 RepID=UPI000C876646|nr:MULTISPECIES: LysR family transcriptional regulator [unclassified Pseudomonas]PMU92017.1 LysR family transcriptional regulator [Pseudomonas sp. GW704-F3]PMU97705.1 LysR family transcriptional regulator [Pseudomonas sp. GW704-F5]PMV08799.1 LysR family transcriptional regulator [Pseudomonas sp. MPBD4-3]PMV35779.1 LysR family transcriptional regulator [Pseudomonas sp. GW704-F2]